MGSPYVPSGRVGNALVLLPLVILLAVPILAAAYAYADVYIPIGGYITLVLVVAFAFAIGWSVSKVGFLAKCRSVAVQRTAGVVAGVTGLYCSWVLFEYALMQRADASLEITPVELFLAPTAVFGIAAEISKEGWFSIFGMTPSGAVLWALWAVEAAIIVGLAYRASTFHFEKRMFCESCEAWCRDELKTNDFALPTSEVMDRLKDGDAAVLSALLPAPHDRSTRRVRVQVQACPQCDDQAGMVLQTVHYETDKDGKVEAKAETVSDVALIDRAWRERLEATRAAHVGSAS
jgi:hypothetical protein